MTRRGDQHLNLPSKLMTLQPNCHNKRNIHHRNFFYNQMPSICCKPPVKLFCASLSKFYSDVLTDVPTFLLKLFTLIGQLILRNQHNWMGGIFIHPKTHIFHASCHICRRGFILQMGSCRASPPDTT